MKALRFDATLVPLTTLAVTQDFAREPVPVKSVSGEDFFSTLQANRDLGMFVAAAQSSGMAKMLRGEGPLTVFALSDRAFINLRKEDREIRTEHTSSYTVFRFRQTRRLRKQPYFSIVAVCSTARQEMKGEPLASSIRSIWTSARS
jgi:hypothetical protein